MRAPVCLSGARVLVAEDNAVNLEVASFHLEDLGCAFTSAENGALALAMARKQPFDFILMDCQMPVMDGFQALQAIRAHQTANNCPRATIIAVTASDDTESQMKCADAGFDGFLAKPFSAAQLQAVMLDCKGSLPGSEERSGHATTGANDISSSAPTVSSPLDRSAFAAFITDFGDDTAPSLLGSFVKLMRETETRLDAARAVKDAHALQSLAHKVAGASGTVGALPLYRLALQIQTSCKSGQPDWTGNVDRLRLTLQASLNAVQPLLDPEALRNFLARSSKHQPSDHQSIF